MKQSTTHEYFTDDNGRALVRLRVNGSDTSAITEAALFDNAKRRHGLSGNLYANDDGSGKRRYVMASLPGGDTHSPLARLLLDCPKGYHVRYNNGNPLDLLPENLRLVSTWADPSVRDSILATLLEHARAPQEATYAHA